MTVPFEYSLYQTEPGDSSDVSYTDIKQGHKGDCYFLSAIGELAILHPDDIKNMVHDNGDGTLSVKLYTPYGHSFTTNAASGVDLQPEFFTVSMAGLLSEGGYSPWQNGVYEIWPEVIETAFAVACGGVDNMGNGGFAFASYAALSGNAADVILPSAITQEQLSTNWAKGNSIVFDTDSSNSQYGLVEKHAYMFDGFTLVDGNTCVVLKNPWGFNNPAPIPLSEIQSGAVNIGAIEISNYGPPKLHVAPAAESLVLNISGSHENANPEFMITIDGVPVGFDGQPSTFTTFTDKNIGDFDEIIANDDRPVTLGNHTVSIALLNGSQGGNLYVNSLTYEGQTINANTQIINDTPLNITIGHPIAPPREKIVINVSDDSYQGSALFTVSVDGEPKNQVYTATAEHDLGQSLAITLDGEYAPGQHTVAVTFLDDLGDNSAGYHTGLDRNLYVDSITYNGDTTAFHDRFDTNGTQNFVVGTPVTPQGQIALNVSEIADNNEDAQFTVAVDGVDTGRIYTATGNAYRGETNQVILDGHYDAGQHAITLNYLNSTFDINTGQGSDLDLISVDFLGQHTDENRRLAYTTQQNFVIGSPLVIANDQIALNVSEDAFQGDAQFTVAVDGVSTGRVYTAAAWHEPDYRKSVDTTAQIVLDGTYSTGHHIIAVNYVNYDASDRHLYVDSITYQGETITENADFSSSNTQDFSVGHSDTTAPTEAPVSAPPSDAGGNDLSDASGSSHSPADTSPAIFATDSIVLHLSEDAYQGDANFTVFVDGAQVTAQSVTALHALGQTQDFVLNGDFGTSGHHSVVVNFTNDAWDGTADTDRNLYVDSIDVNGQKTTENAMQARAGSVAYDVSGPVASGTHAVTATDQILVSLSEDAYQGDARFIVSVDGVRVGGEQSVTASHAAGDIQNFVVDGDFGNSGHHTVAITFTNDAWGGTADTDRNLYVHSISMNGTDTIFDKTMLNADTSTFDVAGPGASLTMIADFVQGVDKIDLHGYGFSAANFEGTALQAGVRGFAYDPTHYASSGHDGPYTQVEIDVNGDGHADHNIEIDTGHLTLNASDFMFS